MKRISQFFARMTVGKSLLIMGLLVLITLGLIFTLEWKQYQDRERFLQDLAAKMEASLDDPEFLLIESVANETRIMGVIPVTVNHVLTLDMNENLSSEELHWLLQGDQLRLMVLANTDFSADHFQALTRHSTLDTLILSDCQLGIHWKQFLWLDSLRRFSFGRVTFLQDPIPELPPDLSHLAHFGMTGQTVESTDLDFLLEPTVAVQSLALIECKLSPEVIEAISKITSLTTLNLQGSEFEGSTLSRLRSLTNLTSLNLAETSITDEDARFLAEMGSLDYLYLAGCENITLKTRDRLDSAKALTSLQLVTFGPVNRKLLNRAQRPIPLIDRREK